MPELFQNHKLVLGFYELCLDPWTARRSTVHPEGDQPWDFFGRNDAKAETPVLWPPHAKS